ncbi:MAG: phospho-N-acetylmuramoyl-pentapeptide-transferase [Rickettsiales bacterium]|nr:phospho-N-acetylmuramoyl-pentapeptide-transferase [Rickettsiales bacterium]OUV78993.1 MAG: phospho-N-acetylmuramoyl-pentapeptide-transferase [Rickettsiales bacterium TMED131]|tara:strand:+ start:2247 stop:3332 length:1086 start_codon:yes stop_codon:yes gene_type:complete
MIHYIALLLVEQFSFLNIFKYLTFRASGAFITSILISFVVGPHLIKYFKVKQKLGQPIRDDGPKWHIDAKKGTPTMGGALILLALTISIILWIDISNLYTWLLLFITLSFGLIGFADDYLKLKRFSFKGLSGKIKLILQSIVALIFSYFLLEFSKESSTQLLFPIFKNLFLDLGYFWFIFTLLVIVGSSNSVNLTDGLDGLAIVPIIIVLSTFSIISYLVGNAIYAEYLTLKYISGAGEISVFCAAFIGAGLGFLWFNAPPAKIFMGDTGSLASGAAIGGISVITKNEIVLLIAGGLFVLEAISVIVQVCSFKLTGKRVFRMAPLHHHFEQKGWSESTIVIRFWIISIILAMISLVTFKIR